MNSWMSVESLGVLAAVEDVEHWHRQRHARAQVPVQGDATGGRSRMGHRQRHAEHCIGAHGRLVGGSIGVKEPVVHGPLVVGGDTRHR